MSALPAFNDLDEPGPTTLAAVPDPPGWRPRGQADLAPTGEKAKARANLAALHTLQVIQHEDRPATPDEAAVLAHWAGWGALPNIFDDTDTTWAAERAELRTLILTADQWAAARETTINAHYTSAEVVKAMWAAVVDLGFTGGKVLEPGCGSGNFIGLAPELPIEAVGIELDPTTAAIAAALYPHADIRCEGFEDSRFAPDHFDLVVGNVPFANLAMHDPVWNKPRHSIHNHFIIKALHFLRPGGLAVVLTSRYTLDSRNPAARREMAALAELVGAVRLPVGAFHASAGTQAMMDMLILRRRTDDASLFSTAWSALATVAAGAATTEVNEYFGAHPAHMLGTVGLGRSMYRDGEFILSAGDTPLADMLALTLAEIVSEARQRDLGWVAPPRSKVTALRPRRSRPRAAAPPVVSNVETPIPAVVVPPPPRKEGTILATDGHTGFGVVRYGVIEDYQPNPRCETAELGVLVRLRDILVALLEVQSSSGDDGSFAALQGLLNTVYDSYAATYGCINRFKLARTGRIDAGGDDVTRRIRPRLGGFRASDPDFPSLLALEVFDPDSQTAAKAPIFSTRVVAPRERRTAAATARDALSMCLDEHGEVRLEAIAKLLSVEPDVALGDLGDLVWENPETGELEVAQRYLSGNVRTKLRRARSAAEHDPRFAAHVAALEAALPEDLGPTEIDARLGATWIPTADIEAFLADPDILGVRDPSVTHVAVTATWNVSVDSYQRRTVAMSSTWGTGRCDAGTLIEHSCNQQAITVYDTLDDKTRIVNNAETLAAREKQEMLADRFAAWIWEDPERASRLVRTYNDRFNSIVTPTYDGSHLTLPGLSEHLTPHPHQLNSIWRMICEPTVGLFHPVGAGKTMVMASGCVELRRLGFVRKPVIVVPNHMLEQFCAEFLQHYPLARVLLATKDQTEKAARKQFVARCATGDWDAVIITRSAFERIPLSAEARAEFLRDKMADFEAAIHATAQAESDGKRAMSVKRLVKAVAKMRERHETLMAAHRKDDGVNFQAAGFDYIVYDEAHGAKNLPFPTRIQGIGGDGSQRAEDLDAKLAFLRNRFGARVCTLATATPVANSLAEIYVMQSFLQPDVLVEAKVRQFDAWAANFGRTINQLELAPDGSTYRIGSRFARFRNVPDLMRMFRAVADVLTPDDLKATVRLPAVTGGQAEVVVVAPTHAHEVFMEHLAGRAEAVRNKLVHPEDDNMLTVATDGRKASLHMRLPTVKEHLHPEFVSVLAGAVAVGGTDKVEVAADRIAGIHAETRDLRFLDPTGNVGPRPGAFQLVFCDLGTPHDGRWSVYEELRSLLVARGVPVEQIRFIHEAHDDRAKAELFAACRDGRIAVLVASTEKGGVGTNIQARMVALHHIDCPWRPCDIEQREGRGIRQGNQNASIRIIRYVTERTFDTYLWQTVARKAAFIYQVMSGKYKGREVDDLGETALSFAEVKALATGNPLLMEEAGVATELSRLVRARRAHHQDQLRLARLLETNGDAMDRCMAVAQECEAAIARRIPTSGAAFRMTVLGVDHDSRPKAGDALKEHLRDTFWRATNNGHTETVATLGGLDITATWRTLDYSYGGRREVTVTVAGTRIGFWMSEATISGLHPQGFVQQLEHAIQNLDRDRENAIEDHDRFRREMDAARDRVGLPFPDEVEMVKLQRRADEIAAALDKLAEEQKAEKERRRAG